MELPFLGYTFATGEALALTRLRLAKRQRSGSIALFSVPDHDVA